MTPRLETIEQWVAMLREAELPVLARTVSELKRMRADEDNVSPVRIAQTVLHDPIMTIKVLQYLQEHRNMRRNTEITTIAHALMMLGLHPFFERFAEQPVLEDRLAEDPASLLGVRRVLSRARHAALYAQDWAVQRHDVDPEEVMIAALLHDMAEMMLWCYAPRLAREIAARQQRDPALRSERAQREVLGFRLIDLQLQLVGAWHLPALLRLLIDQSRARNPRVASVALAVDLARHSAHGWDNPALPDDYAGIARLLGLSYDEVFHKVVGVARRAAGEFAWYGVAPAAAALPAVPVPPAQNRE